MPSARSSPSPARSAGTARFRLTEDLIGAVLGQLPAGVQISDATGAVVYVNDALRSILRGAAPQAADDALAWRGSHADGTPYEPADWPGARCLDGETVTDEEIDIVRLDGTPAVVRISAAPIRDAVGRIVAGVVIANDITARRHSDELRDAFAAVLSHELRTPVATIFGAAKVLERRADRLAPALRNELSADIAAEAGRLQRLVDDLLVLARVERGVDLSVDTPVLVHHLLRAVLAGLAAEWPDRRFEGSIPDRVPPVAGDESYLEQVLRNLLGNAAKYGREVIEVQVAVLPRMVRVSVLDDGPGLRTTEPERLFRLFYRARHDHGVPGAGIGLFVARSLAEAMGARLWAEDRAGGGAAFHLELRRFEGLDADD